MDIPGPTLWWVIAGIVVAAELATGTFYLLMIGVGLVAGAVAAHLGLGSAAQIATAAFIGGAATLLLQWRRASGPRDAPPAQNRNVNLDVGERVHVPAWSADGTARVQYRGTGWTVRLAAGSAAVPGDYLVAAVDGNSLVLAPAPAPAPPDL